MASRSRLDWLCRRGTRELDILLTRFLETGYDDAPPETQAAFGRLLEWQDPELYDCLIGRSGVDDREIRDVIERIVHPDRY